MAYQREDIDGVHDKLIASDSALAVRDVARIGCDDDVSVGEVAEEGASPTAL